MAAASTMVIQAVGFLAGSLCLYIAFFLYEDEEKQLQNALEILWIRINDRSDGASTFVGRLLTETAGLSSRAFDAVFGPTLFSMRAVAVSFSCALASISVFLIAAAGPSSVPAAWIIPLVFVVAGSLPALTGSRKIERLVFLLPLSFAIFLILFTWTVASDPVRRADPAGREFLLITYIFVGSLLLSAPIDFLWSLLARWVLSTASRSRRTLTMAMSLLIHVAVPVALFGIGLSATAASVMHWNPWLGAFLLLLMASRAFLLATTSVFSMAFAVVLLHRAVWPLLDRAIYAAARHRLLQNRKLVGIFGLALIAVAAGTAPFNPAQFQWIR